MGILQLLNIKRVDEILVLNKGILEAIGNHEKLLENNDIYKELYNSQKELL